MERMLRQYLVHHLLLLLSLPYTPFSRSIITRLPGVDGILPFKLETGYVGIGEREEVQLFYYFVESERDPAKDPLLLWNTGGPGCSTLHTMLFEGVGPFAFDEAKSSQTKPAWALNPYSWTKVANIIFLDQPVGTGFSYATTREAAMTSDILSATQAYTFLRKWLTGHPEFLGNPLYLCGTSYAGIVIPITVLDIVNGNEAGIKPWLNIKGYVMGNPSTDDVEEINSGVKFTYHMAIIPYKLYKLANVHCGGNYAEKANRSSRCTEAMEQIYKCYRGINFAHILEPACPDSTSRPNMPERERRLLEEDLIELPSSFDPQEQCRNQRYINTPVWANDRVVQHALRIREGTKEKWMRCNYTLTAAHTRDVKSSVTYHQKLLAKGIRVLISSGDHDMIVTHDATEKWINGLNLTVENPWRAWMVDNQVAGHVTTYSRDRYSLTFAIVKGAGHTGAEYKPKQYLAMADRWFSHAPI